MAAHHPIAGDDQLLHAEVLAAVRHELVDFFERAGVEQPGHALARRQLALVMLFFEPLFAAAKLGETLAFAQSLDRIHISRQRTGCPTCRLPAP
jgi:hypothetical protein